MTAADRKMKRALDDAFYGGYCCALQAALDGDDGTSTAYLEAVRAVGARNLLNYARRAKETELPNIRRAVRALQQREDMQNFNGGRR